MCICLCTSKNTYGYFIESKYSAYLYYDKVIENGHRLYIRGEGQHNYGIIKHLYERLEGKYTYEQIKEYIHVLIPDNRAKSELTTEEIDFCNDLNLKVSRHLQLPFSLAQLFIKC